MIPVHYGNLKFLKIPQEIHNANYFSNAPRTPDLEKEWQIIGKAFKSNMYYKGDIPSELDENLTNLCPN